MCLGFLEHLLFLDSNECWKVFNFSVYFFNELGITFLSTVQKICMMIEFTTFRKIIMMHDAELLLFVDAS